MWIHYTVVVLAIISSAAAMPAQTHEDASFTLNGTWIGWAWLGDAGDLPLRLHLAVSNGELSAMLDSPAHRMNKAPLEIESWEAPSIRLSGPSPKGSLIRIGGVVHGTTIEGTIDWSEYSGQFELIRSPRPLVAIDPDRNASATGFYEHEPGELIELSARHWGETLYRELRTGRVRTLLPTGPDRFFVGSGIYRPQPVEADVILSRDSVGRVTSLEERDSRGRSRTFRRVEMVEAHVSFESGSATIHGTILRRAGADPTPAIVMMGGSNWETRDDVSFRSRMLAALGFTVLIYD